MNRKRIAFIAEILIALAAALGIAKSQGWNPTGAFLPNARWLSDGFFVVGVVYTGIGILIWISTTGFFDIMGYGLHSLWVLFTPFKRPQEHESYYDYKQVRDSKRGKPRYRLLAEGVVCILLSLLFLWLYYRA